MNQDFGCIYCCITVYYSILLYGARDWLIGSKIWSWPEANIPWPVNRMSWPEHKFLWPENDMSWPALVIKLQTSQGHRLVMTNWSYNLQDPSWVKNIINDPAKALIITKTYPVSFSYHFLNFYFFLKPKSTVIT